MMVMRKLPNLKRPTAPQAYRPQPVPKVLQTKSATAQPQAIVQSRKAAIGPPIYQARQPVAPPVYRPQPLPKVLQAKRSANQTTHTDKTPRQPVAPPVYRTQSQRGKTVQCMQVNTPSMLEQVLAKDDAIVDSIFSSLSIPDISSLAVTSTGLLTIYKQEVERKVNLLGPAISEVPYEFVELGAGPMYSALAFWASFERGVFTEYRSLAQLFNHYGVFVGNQFLKLWRQKSKERASSSNAIVLGVDATCLVKAPCLLKTAVLRFTNPNIGNQDVTKAIKTHLIPAITNLGENEDELWVRSGRQLFKVELPEPLIQWLKESPQSHESKLFGYLKQTAYIIAVYRNLDLLGRFFANACHWLVEEGEVQLVCLQGYIKQWNIIEIAARAGWHYEGVEAIELGFKHMQTQEAEEVGKGKNMLLRFKPRDLIKQLQEMIEFISEMKVASQGKHLVLEVKDGRTPVNGRVIEMGDTWE